MQTTTFGRGSGKSRRLLTRRALKKGYQDEGMDWYRIAACDGSMKTDGVFPQWLRLIIA